MQIQRDVWLCVDCLFQAENGDTSGIDDDARAAEVVTAVAAMGRGLSANFDSNTEEGIRGFSRCGCDCCGSRLAGAMHRYAILVDDGTPVSHENDGE